MVVTNPLTVPFRREREESESALLTGDGRAFTFH
jgi:hypothetical protein